ncbi:PDZ domain-containing protein [Cytobacillus oceanisediminis]|uniref:PDZ domain-containing protein n=1 Tax=Cytobacillus oceanisediminis TaxID=665099 RepID=UPI001C23D694|nr:PDZ domain-containing protein [Cytobacillus oceanisediminis]MBU8772120.1 PDZ domain-containing protein [Cytobacillus oceanisediminis]
MRISPKDSSVNTTFIESSLEKVWWSIATPEGMNSYLTYTAETTGSVEEPKVGDEYTLCYGDIINNSKVVECEPLKKFTILDSYESIAPDGSVDKFYVKTKFQLEEVGNFVKIQLIVVGFEEDTHGQWFRECLEMGWRRSLMNLKSVLELGMDLRTEMFSYPRLGIVNCTVNEEQSIDSKVPAGEGNFLLEVFPNSPAFEAGLRKGDVIVALDGVETPTYKEFVKVISSYYLKETDVSISYHREGQEFTTIAKLSIEDIFTGLVELEGTSFDEVKTKREKLARQRSASGSLWGNK